MHPLPPGTIQLAPGVVSRVDDRTSTPAYLDSEFLVLRQSPSEAFGDGSHPTTRLCAGAVDFICRLGPPNAVLDVGTGTGILARIARARGARRICATDIDPAALVAARKNFSLDVSQFDIELSSSLPDSWGAVFDLVIANILEQPLLKLAPRLTGAMRPGGTLLVSGFTRRQVPGLRVAFEACGLKLTQESFLEDWGMLSFRREEKKPESGPA